MWIKIDCDLPGHPKLRKFARECNLKDNEAIGVLIQVWAWARKYADDGDLGRWTDEEISLAANIGSGILKGMEAAGFTKDGWICSWNEYGGCEIVDRIRKNPSTYAQKYNGFIEHYGMHKSAHNAAQIRGDKRRGDKNTILTVVVSAEAEAGYQEYPTTRVIDGEKTSTCKQLKHKEGIQRAINDGYPFREVVRLKKAAGDAFPNLKTFLDNLPDPVELRKFGKDKPAYQECHPLKHDWAEPVDAGDGTLRKKCRQCPRVETIYG